MLVHAKFPDAATSFGCSRRNSQQPKGALFLCALRLPRYCSSQTLAGAGDERGESMSRTLWIILGVAVAAGLAVLWFSLSPGSREGDLGETGWIDPPVEVANEAVPVDAPTEEMPVVEPAASAEETAAGDSGETESTHEAIPRVEEPQPSYAIDGLIEEGEYPDSTVISGVTVYWSNNAEILKVGLASPGTGYLSIGFDPDRRMEEANFILAYMADGEIHTRDDYGIGMTSHGPDIDRGGADNVLAAAGVEWADSTIVEFMIPLDSGDPSDKPLLPGGTYTVLVAYHDLRDELTLRHSRRGTGEITLQSL